MTDGWDTRRCAAYARTCSSIDPDDWAFMQQLERELTALQSDLASERIKREAAERRLSEYKSSLEALVSAWA